MLLSGGFFHEIHKVPLILSQILHYSGIFGICLYRREEPIGSVKYMGKMRCHFCNSMIFQQKRIEFSRERRARGWLSHYRMGGPTVTASISARAWDWTMPGCQRANWLSHLLHQQGWTMVLACHRLGIRPLFYTLHKGNFYFASEI